MSTTAEPQTSLYETTIEDAALEGVLETRETLKAKRSAANKAFKEANDQAKALIGALDLGEGAPVRVGRFVVKYTPIPAKTVAFETDPSSRLQISLLAE